MSTRQMGVMPPPSPKPSRTLTLGPNRWSVDAGFRIISATGSHTVTVASPHSQDQPELPMPDGDGFYARLPALRITAGPGGAELLLEYHPGVQKKGGPEGPNPHVRY